MKTVQNYILLFLAAAVVLPMLAVDALGEWIFKR
jgi:hypothetical protein